MKSSLESALFVQPIEIQRHLEFLYHALPLYAFNKN